MTNEVETASGIVGKIPPLPGVTPTLPRVIYDMMCADGHEASASARANMRYVYLTEFPCRFHIPTQSLTLLRAPFIMS